ncbi:hypothetical protein M885DRAFT_617790, partial [Pelagophyceae sp. CCMP2097]
MVSFKFFVDLSDGRWPRGSRRLALSTRALHGTAQPCVHARIGVTGGGSARPRRRPLTPPIVRDYSGPLGGCSAGPRYPIFANKGCYMAARA